MIRILTIAGGALLYAAAAVANENAPTQVVVAGRWINLPLPAGTCVLNESPDAEMEFSAGLRLGALKDGQQVLLPFADCTQLAAYRDGTATVRFSYGSYDAAMTDGAVSTLPEKTTPDAYLAHLRASVPKVFDAAATSAMFAEKVAPDSDPSQVSFYKSEPDANYVAILQRFEPEHRKDKPIVVAAMRATTVVAHTPVIVMMIRFDGHDASIFETLQNQEAEVVRRLRAANP